MSQALILCGPGEFRFPSDVPHIVSLHDPLEDSLEDSLYIRLSMAISIISEVGILIENCGPDQVLEK
jgi:hypothetical protein